MSAPRSYGGAQERWPHAHRSGVTSPIEGLRTMGCRTLRLGFSVIVCAFVAACGGGGGGGGGSTPTPPQSQSISFATAGPVSSAVGTTVTNAASGGQGSGAISYASSNTAVG